MKKNRVESFSDGVLAIVITIMVLELETPRVADLSALKSLAPALFGYLLSFIYIGIYWSNHHHLFHAVERVDGSVLWANLHLLFWLTLVPFVTAWADDSRFAAMPTALYGFVLLMAGAAYLILARLLIARHGGASMIARAIGEDRKGKVSVVLYAAAMAVAFWSPRLAVLIYWAVALIWLVPDRRIERETAG